MPKTHIEMPREQFSLGCDCGADYQQGCPCHHIKVVTMCGMYRHEPEMSRNQGNRFELAERPFEATCLHCRAKAGLPKTVRACRYDDGIFSGHSLIDTEVYSPTHPLGGLAPEWKQSPLSRASLPMLGPIEWKDHPDLIRRIISFCPHYHVLIVFKVLPKVDGIDEMKFAVLRRLEEPFGPEYDDYKPNFDIGLPQDEKRKTRWERLLEDDLV